MDKTDFIRIAPVYYELAVALEVRRQAPESVSETDLINHYTSPEDENSDEYCFLQKRALLKKAIQTLVAKGALQIIEDDFGPALYKRGNAYDDHMQLMESDTKSPYYKSAQASDRTLWVRQALSNLNDKYDELDVRERDIQDPEAEWSPIPLDKDNPKLQAAIVAVNNTLTEVEANNGYAAEFPEERNFVIANLALLSKTLSTAQTTSVSFIRAHGIAILKKLSDRFEKAALGKLIDIAVSALLSFLGLN